MKSKDKILKFIGQKGQVTIHELTEKLNVSRQYIHRLINELEEDLSIQQIGSAPKSYYILLQNRQISSIQTTYEQEVFLKEHFLTIDPLGKLLEGTAGMVYWSNKQNLPISKTILEYIETRKKYLQFYNEERLINGLAKLKNTEGIGSIGIDALYYLDFYAIERFGKTHLGTLMHYAKQGQNKMLMNKIVQEINQRIQNFISKHGVDAVLFVPPTINRKIQIMDYLKKHLQIELPYIKIDKIKTTIVIPQKALSKLFERVENAKNTFYIPSQNKHHHVLILDDAIGSGATINEIALKLKEKKIATKVTGLSITGSYKGFEVISEL